MGLMFAKIGLAPILFAQGKFVRKKVPILPEPEGLRRGVSGAGKPLRLLILGDSSAAGVGVANQNEALLGKVVARLVPHFEIHWRLIATTGATSAFTLRSLQEIQPETFDVVLLSVGLNDVTSNRSKKAFLGDQASILDLLKTKFGASLIIISELPPIGKFPSLPKPLNWYLGGQSRRFDAARKSLVENRFDCEYLKFDETFDPSLMASDGFHPGAELYSAWPADVAQIIINKLR